MRPNLFISLKNKRKKRRPAVLGRCTKAKQFLRLPLEDAVVRKQTGVQGEYVQTSLDQISTLSISGGTFGGTGRQH